MKSVYIVTYGSEMVAVFSSRTDANRYLKEHYDLGEPWMLDLHKAEVDKPGRVAEVDTDKLLKRGDHY